MKIGLFYGGRSYEREISVITAIQLQEHTPEDYELIPIYIDKDGLTVLKDFKDYKAYQNVKGKKTEFINGGVKVGSKKIKLDCALVVTHGGNGEDGRLSATLDFYKIPYTCCDHYSAAVCMDKLITKSMLNTFGFKTAKSLEEPTFPCIIKPRRLGSSIGVKVARDQKEYKDGIEFASYFDAPLVEEYLENVVELNCAAVKSKDEIIVSAVEKPNTLGDILNFDDKYVNNNGRVLPADIGEELTEKIRQTTSLIYQKLGLFGVVRIDYMLNKDNELLVNEINAIPGSMAFYLFEPLGISYRKLITILVEEGIKRNIEKIPIFNSDVLNKYAEGYFGVKGKN